MAAVTAPGPRRAYPPGRVRTVLVGGAVVCVLAVVGFVVTSGDEKSPTPLFVALPSVPPVAVSPQTPSAAAPTGPSNPPVTSRVRAVATPPGTVAGTPRSTGAGSTPPAATSPAVALPVVGADVGLEPVGEPGRRVRHHNFVARIDRIGPDSRELDRADSRFTVRTGRDGAGCLSFESVNYPGYFLRSRDSALRLERPQGAPGYDADATFCAVPVGPGFVLGDRRSPKRYVTLSDSVLSLRRVTPAEAQAFVARPPL